MSRIVIRSSLLVCLLTLAALPARAQQIQGQVRYAQNGQSAIGVRVHCNGTGGTSDQITDRNGKFYFRVSPGHYEVTVSEPGFREETQSRDLIDTQQSEYLTFTLKPDAKTVARTTTTSAPDVKIPSDAQKEFQKAEAAFAIDKKESQQEGIADLQKALSIYPAYLQAELRLGTAYMDLQQWDKAEAALKRALEIDPHAANAFFALGEVYRREKKYDQAEKTLLDGLAVETRSAQAHLTLARVYWDKTIGIKDEAQWRPFLEKSYTETNQALTLDASLAGAHLLKGNLLFKVRRAEDALKEYDEYLRLDPKGEFAEQTRTLADKIRKAVAETKKP